MALSGLGEQDLAKRVNYSHATLNLFLNNRYHEVSGDDSAICAAVESFMQAEPVSLETETEGALYETENVRLLRKYFYEALDWGVPYYFRGAPGTQKSFVLRSLVAELNRQDLVKNGHGRRAFYIYCSQGIRPTQLMKDVAIAARSISTGDTRRIFRNLRFDLRGRKSLFIFDEAQHLDIPCLETVRELHDMPPHSGLLFAGSHEIETTFNRLDMEQWASRLRKGAELPGIQEDEAEKIIRAELGPKANVKYLVSNSYAKDLRKGRETKYISARYLFGGINKIRRDRQKDGDAQ
ncbi:MAG: ATP-binding protein [Acidobacteriia bacterium]|nr:ATP-binding protein [Terriglobia bacterium]